MFDHPPAQTNHLQTFAFCPPITTTILSGRYSRPLLQELPPSLFAFVAPAFPTRFRSSIDRRAHLDNGLVLNCIHCYRTLLTTSPLKCILKCPRLVYHSNENPNIVVFLLSVTQKPWILNVIYTGCFFNCPPPLKMSLNWTK